MFGIDLDQAVSTAAILVPFVLAIVEMAKRTGLVDKYAGIASVVSGIVLAFLVGEFGSVGEVSGFDTLKRTLLVGVIAGLSASGVYSATKAAVSGPTVTGSNV